MVCSVNLNGSSPNMLCLFKPFCELRKHCLLKHEVHIMNSYHESSCLKLGLYGTLWDAASCPVNIVHCEKSARFPIVFLLVIHTYIDYSSPVELQRARISPHISLIYKPHHLKNPLLVHLRIIIKHASHCFFLTKIL